MSTDALSELLQRVRLRGQSITVADDREVPVRRFARGDRVLHIVQRGRLQIRSGRGPAEVLDAGDLALVARGGAHTVRPGPDTRWVTGVFDVDTSVADPLLAVLPPALVVRAGGPGQEWLPLSFDLLLAETGVVRAGAHVMVSRILDLLFIHALRAWAAEPGERAVGWLTGALDPAIAPVLAELHRAPEVPWTVQSMADRAAMSRASFAAHFRARLGESPAAYLQGLRMDRAAELLASTTDPIASIARAVGYDSDAAFSRAFLRAQGCTPRAWRSSSRAG